MDLNSLLSLISGMNSNNSNINPSSFMNFFAQNKQNTSGQSENIQNKFNLNQILPLLLSLNAGSNGLDLSKIIPFFQMPMNNSTSEVATMPAQKQQNEKNNISSLSSNSKKISDYKKI